MKWFSNQVTLFGWFGLHSQNVLFFGLIVETEQIQLNRNKKKKRSEELLELIEAQNVRTADKKAN